MQKKLLNTGDGRNPVPVDIQNICFFHTVSYITCGPGFLPSTVCSNFFWGYANPKPKCERFRKLRSKRIERDRSSHHHQNTKTVGFF